MAMQPRNRQEFLRMQEQAIAAARDMQRRSALKGHSRNPESGGRTQGNFAQMPAQPRQPPKALPPAAPASRASRTDLHHQSPSQQARQCASYGRAQPQIRHQKGQDWQEDWWKEPTQRPASRQNPSRNPETGYRNPGRFAQQRGQPQRGQPRGGQQYAPPPQPAPPPPPPPPPPPQPQATASMPGMAEIFAMLGGMGGAGKSPGGQGGQGPKPDDEDRGEGGMDSVLVILLLFLLQKEKADQGLLLALMYIMM